MLPHALELCNKLNCANAPPFLLVRWLEDQHLCLYEVEKRVDILGASRNPAKKIDKLARLARPGCSREGNVAYPSHCRFYHHNGCTIFRDTFYSEECRICCVSVKRELLA